MTNCPNCGAPVKGYECEYCGTVFRDVLHDTNMKIEAETTILQSMAQFANVVASMGSYITPNECRELMGLKRI